MQGLNKTDAIKTQNKCHENTEQIQTYKKKQNKKQTSRFHFFFSVIFSQAEKKNRTGQVISGTAHFQLIFFCYCCCVLLLPNAVWKDSIVVQNSRRLRRLISFHLNLVLCMQYYYTVHTVQYHQILLHTTNATVAYSTVLLQYRQYCVHTRAYCKTQNLQYVKKCIRDEGEPNKNLREPWRLVASFLFFSIQYCTVCSIIIQRFFCVLLYTEYIYFEYSTQYVQTTVRTVVQFSVLLIIKYHPGPTVNCALCVLSVL